MPVPEAVRKELALLHAELDKQRDRYSRKEGAKNTRGLVLIGASTVLAGFSLAPLDSPLHWTNVPFAFVAVSLGVIALRPSSGREIDLHKLEKEIRDADQYRAELILYRNKSSVHDEDIAHLEKRSRLISAGFWVLGAGLLVSVLAAYVWFVIG